MILHAGGRDDLREFIGGFGGEESQRLLHRLCCRNARFGSTRESGEEAEDEKGEGVFHAKWSKVQGAGAFGQAQSSVRPMSRQLRLSISTHQSGSGHCQSMER